MECMELNNGIKMPTVGIGVFTFTPEEAEKSVEAALKSGYHLVDTKAIGISNFEGKLKAGDVVSIPPNVKTKIDLWKS